MRPLVPHNALLAGALMLCIGLGGCGLVYKVNVQQGNILDQEMVDQLEPGMTKSQVRMVLGTPAIADPFHHDRWDYIATFSPDGEEMTRKHFQVVFEDNRLVRMEGDYFPSEAQRVASGAPEQDEEQTEALVEQALERTSEEGEDTSGPVAGPRRPRRSPQDGQVGGPIPPTDEDPSGGG